MEINSEENSEFMFVHYQIQTSEEGVAQTFTSGRWLG